MEYALVGDSGSGATLRLDYRAFAYAGKFVLGAPGKAVLRTADGSSAVPEWEPGESLPPTVDPDAFDDDVVAAVSFSPDRTDPSCCRLRYVTVHVDRRGEGLGPELIAHTVSRLEARGYDEVRIAVNNPFAYEAMYKIGFAYTGERTGIAELELARPVDAPASAHGDVDRYQSGLDRFRKRDLGGTEARFLAERSATGPPGPDRS
ncbi:GNAT family N-acetyltransferase [Halorubrum sp. DTA98]|uniref:GNAT family N-acetyltransferase n=1 Tax=Halorubrum sp. DTA98 TaxID=3402163 RepID=UPI003AAB392E